MIAGIDFDSFGAYVVSVPLDPSLDDDPDFGIRFVVYRFPDAGLDSDLRSFVSARRAGEVIADDPFWRHVRMAWIERGRGASRKQDWMLGRAQGAVAASIPEWVEVWETELNEWKGVLGVNTRLKSAGQKAHVIELLRGLGYGPAGDRFPDANLWDALAIAVVAREKADRAGRASAA